MRFGFIALSLSLVASTAAAEDFDAKSFLAENAQAVMALRFTAVLTHA